MVTKVPLLAMTMGGGELSIHSDRQLDRGTADDLFINGSMRVSYLTTHSSRSSVNDKLFSFRLGGEKLEPQQRDDPPGHLSDDSREDEPQKRRRGMWSLHDERKMNDDVDKQNDNELETDRD